MSAAESSAGVEAPAAGGPGAGSGAGIGSDSSGARAIYAPQPVIPDSLREEAFQTVAVARFKVTYDGRVQVALITPTESPQLNELLLETLKTWRRREASERAVPPYVVFHDRTLAAIAAVRPRSLEELAEVPGIGPTKLAAYGKALLGLIAARFA